MMLNSFYIVRKYKASRLKIELTSVRSSIEIHRPLDEDYYYFDLYKTGQFNMNNIIVWRFYE